MWPAVRDQRPFFLVLTGLVTLAWGALWAWGHSPYGRFLDHAELAHTSPAEAPLFFLAALGGWTLMIVAMMLPTSLPLVARSSCERFRIAGSRQADRLGVVRRRRRRATISHSAGITLLRLSSP